LKSGVEPERFCESARELLSFLHEREFIEGYYIQRRKFAVEPPETGEYLIVVEFSTIEQANRAFEFVTTGGDVIEEFGKTIEPAIKDIHISMYRDFPEPRRRKETGHKSSAGE